MMKGVRFGYPPVSSCFNTTDDNVRANPMPKTKRDLASALDGLPVELTPRRIAQLREIAARDHGEEEAVLQALADRRRLKVLDALMGDELCVCVLVQLLGIKPSALSYHLSLLAEAGLVRARRDGSFQMYSLTVRGESALELLRKLLR